MADNNSITSELKNISYEIFIGAISLLSIVNIFLAYLLKYEEVIEILFIMNTFFTVIFLSDFLYRLFTAKSKKKYFINQYGWADLLASLPFRQVKIFRLFRIFRVYKLSRIYGAKGIVRELLNARGGSALLTILFIAILVFEFGAMAILAAESRSSEANITSASDALWWIMATVTTVGYGDVYPVTDAGRVVGVLVMVTGIGLFGTLTGYLANIFLTPKKE